MVEKGRSLVNGTMPRAGFHHQPPDSAPFFWGGVMTERLEKRIRKTPGCWEWTGEIMRGYGVLNKKRAHRIVYEECIGPIPGGMLICHHCDNRKCVNPDHLFMGTYGDNNRDRARKKRSADMRGEKGPYHKLTWDDVSVIRGSNLGQRILAQIYGVTQTNISCIKTGKSWKV